jgi:magnesium-transporting ATPase (P-type)
VCKEAGITTIMCTGDSLETAKVIAFDCGILLENDNNEIADPYACMTGKQFREAVGGLVTVGDEEVLGNMKMFNKIKRKLRVLARCSPSDKYLLVKGL